MTNRYRALLNDVARPPYLIVGEAVAAELLKADRAEVQRLADSIAAQYGLQGPVEFWTYGRDGKLEKVFR